MSDFDSHNTGLIIILEFSVLVKIQTRCLSLAAVMTLMNGGAFTLTQNKW